MAPRMKFNPRTGKYEAVTPSTTVPKNNTTTTMPRRNTQVPPQGPVNPRLQSSRQGAGLAGQKRIDDPAETQTIIDKIIKGVALTPEEISLYTNIFGDGSGGLTEAQKLEQQRVKNADSYKAGQVAAGIQEQAGVDAQSQYGALAKTTYDTAKTAADTIYTPAVGDTNSYYDKQLAGLKQYVDAQKGAATGSIDSATTDLLAGLKGTSAYQDASVANVAAPTQGLGDALKAYGGTGQSALEQQTMDAASAKQISEMFGRSNKQLAGAETDYYTGLQNSARGAQAAAKQNLAEVLARLQGQDRGTIESGRRSELAGLEANRTAAQNSATDLQTQLLSKGIDSLMSGKQAAATTRAQTTATYGVPKKPKPKPLPKSKTKK